jgi:hypothetical protein
LAQQPPPPALSPSRRHLLFLFPPPSHSRWAPPGRPPLSFSPLLPNTPPSAPRPCRCLDTGHPAEPPAAPARSSYARPVHHVPRRRAHSATRTPPRPLPDRAMRASSRTLGRPATPIPRRAEDPAAASTARARPRAPDATRCPLPHRTTPPCRATPSEPPRSTASRTVHPSTEDLATKIPRRPFITRVKKLQWNRFSFPHSPLLLPPSMNAINGRSPFSSLPPSPDALSL